MVMGVTVLVVMAVLPLAAVGQSGSCDGRQCPSYTATPLATQSTYGTNELRSYAASRWVSTPIQQVRSSYMRLHYYFSGTNVAGQTMSRTVPVVREVRGEEKRFLFFIPATVQAAPAPTDQQVTTLTWGTKQFYVRSWYMLSSRPTAARVAQELLTLKNAVGDASLYQADLYYQAGYRSPMFVGQRRHEVWLLKN